MELATVGAERGAAAPAADGRAFLAFVDKAISHLEYGVPCGPTWAWTVEQVLKSCRAYPSGLSEDELLIGLIVVSQILASYK
jgi:hypothetical protein